MSEPVIRKELPLINIKLRPSIQPLGPADGDVPTSATATSPPTSEQVRDGKAAEEERKKKKEAEDKPQMPKLGELVLLVSGLIGRNEFGRVGVSVPLTSMADYQAQMGFNFVRDQQAGEPGVPPLVPGDPKGSKVSELIVDDEQYKDVASKTSLNEINPVISSAIRVSKRDIKLMSRVKNVPDDINVFLGAMDEDVFLKFAELVAMRTLLEYTNAADRHLYAKHSEVLQRGVPEHLEWFKFMRMNTDNGRYEFVLPEVITATENSGFGLGGQQGARWATIGIQGGFDFVHKQ